MGKVAGLCHPHPPLRSSILYLTVHPCGARRNVSLEIEGNCSFVRGLPSIA